MKLEQQVVSLELAKKLKELGVKQESLFYWNKLSDFPDGKPDWRLGGFKSVEVARENCSAFTVAELGEMLPKGYFTHRIFEKWDSGYLHNLEQWAGKAENADTEADARAKILIYLSENKLM